MSQSQPLYEAPSQRPSQNGTPLEEKFYEPVHVGGQYVLPQHALAQLSLILVMPGFDGDGSRTRRLHMTGCSVPAI